MRQCCPDATVAGAASPRGPAAGRCSAVRPWRRPCARRASVSRVRSAGEAQDSAAAADAVDEALASVVQAVKEAGSLDSSEDEDASAVDLLPLAVDLDGEVQKRRCFAIIAHPDAGKTTLTEKLLLYGGAIHEAGEVRARRGAKNATSDFMAIERERGISISSTAMSFNYRGMVLNLLDTPGHADFSVDTYRTLCAADNALMLIDGGKGLEPQTRKLFEVCRHNGLPIFSFINKMDRPALNPLDLLDEIEKEFGLKTFACNWPIGSGDTFKGVYHRLNKRLYLFKKVASGAKEATVTDLALEDPQAAALLGEELYTALVDDLALLDELDGGLDVDAVWEQRLTPVFFGSAQNNFGVQVFLDTFLDISATPRRMRLADDGPTGGKGGGAAAVAANGGMVTPTDAQFSGFVFKLQANMDPRHRDKVAFLRVVSGEFRRGMKVLHPRTGRTVSLTRPQKMFGQERETTEVAYAGDILGLNNPGLFAVGDTVCTGPARAFPQIPSFSPELFATLRNTNTGKYKQFNKGVAELLSEGAVEAMTSLDAFQAGTPILAAVGQLQFEVVQERMRTEYGCETALEPLPYTVARWVLGGWPALDKTGRIFNAVTVKDCWGRPVLLFRNQWNVDTLLSEQPEIGELSPIGLPPTAAELAQAAARDR